MPANVSLRLDAYGFAQLRLLRRMWPHIPAAEQSNIVGKAAYAAKRFGPINEPYRQFALPESCAPTDVARLSELAELWQSIAHNERCEILECARAMSVSR